MKEYFKRFSDLLKTKALLYFSLTVAFVIAFQWINKDVHKWLFMLFFSTFIIQSLFLWKKCYVFYLLRILLIFILGFQFIWSISNKIAPSPQTITIGAYSERHDVLGFCVKPNMQRVNVTQVEGSDTISNIYYSTDSVCRRISENQFMAKDTVVSDPNQKHAIFLGCSYTFGFSLMYSSTFPYLFEKQNPDYKSYNYGVAGFGPHQVALLFDKRVNTINKNTIKESKGFALYTYIDDHLTRVYGGSPYFRWVHCPVPDVYVDVEHDSLLVKKTPSSRILSAKFLNDLALFVFFKVYYKYPQKESYYKRFAEIINYSARRYWEINPENHFYVSIYPGKEGNLLWLKYLDEKIIILQMDVPKDYTKNSLKYRISQNDMHPTLEFNEYYVNKITELIKKYE